MPQVHLYAAGASQLDVSLVLAGDRAGDPHSDEGALAAMGGLESALASVPGASGATPPALGGGRSGGAPGGEEPALTTPRGGRIQLPPLAHIPDVPMWGEEADADNVHLEFGRI